MEDFIPRKEHEEFCKRMDEANERQSKRLSILEEQIQEVHKTSTAIEKLSINMTHMLEEQKKQGERLEVIENRDGEMWRKVVWCAISAIVSGVIVFALSRIGM